MTIKRQLIGCPPPYFNCSAVKLNVQEDKIALAAGERERELAGGYCREFTSCRDSISTERCSEKLQ
jgi:hypothetical protein